MRRWMWVTCVLAGCGGDAGLELSAGDALHAAAGRMETAIREYHQEVGRQDDARESAVIAAFVSRVVGSREDEAALGGHAQAFESALKKIRADREVEGQRRSAAMENVDVIREVADGLQELAVESLTLRDEVRRYLGSWIEARRRAQSAAGSGGDSHGNP